MRKRYTAAVPTRVTQKGDARTEVFDA